MEDSHKKMLSISCLFTEAQAGIEKADSMLKEKMLWLEEITQTAKALFTQGCVPKTPARKRKRKFQKPVEKIDDNSPSTHQSTFVDDSTNHKKLRIDVSQIDEAEESNLGVNRSTRQSSRLKNKPKRSSLPKKKSKRIAKKQVAYFESPYNKGKENAKSSEKPPLITNTCSPKVTVLIEKLKISAHKNEKKKSPVVMVDEVKQTLFNDVTTINSPTLISTTDVSTPKNLLDKNNRSTPVGGATPPLFDISVVGGEGLGKMQSTPVENTPASPNINATKIAEEKTQQPYETPGFNKTYKLKKTDETTPFHTACETPMPAEETTRKEKETTQTQDETVLTNEKTLSNDKTERSASITTAEETTQNETCKQVSEQDDTKTEKESDCNVETEKLSNVIENVKSPNKENIEQVTLQEPTEERVVIEKCNDIEMKDEESEEEPVSKKPKVVKPVKANIVTGVSTLIKKHEAAQNSCQPQITRIGNLVTGIKSFAKPIDSPKKETFEERQQKKLAELKKKEDLRKKLMEEKHKAKQKAQEDKKRIEEERRKRIAQANAKKEEEKELKKNRMLMKMKQAEENVDHAAKQRELEEAKKRKLRDMKHAEAEQRRLEDEEEQRRKAALLAQEEKEREGELARKAEQQGHERLRKIADHQKAEKERLRQVELERQLDAERLEREFVDREDHRLEVEKKLKEQKEKDRAYLQEKKTKEKEERQRLDNKTEGVNSTRKSSDKPLEKKKSDNKAGEFKVPNAPAWNPPVVNLVVNDTSYIDYGMDLDSDDSTDDECEPTKAIPKWAQGLNLRRQLMEQFYTDVDPSLIFVNAFPLLELDKIFKKRKPRYFKRTSSAHWTSPMLKK